MINIEKYINKLCFSQHDAFHKFYFDGTTMIKKKASNFVMQ